MKLPIKSISIFVCGAAIASLPYTLSLGKANAQGGQSTTSSSSTSKSANSSAQAGSSQYSSSSSTKGGSASQNSSAFDQVRKFANAGQNANSGSSSSNGGGDMPILALTNDDTYVYAAQGNVIYKVRKSDMPTATSIPPRRTEGKP